MLFVAREGDTINTDPGNEYYGSVFDLIQKWEKGEQTFTCKSSGSTGPPKQFSFSREQIEASVRGTQNAFALDSNNLLVCNLDIAYVAGMLMILRSVILKADLLVIQPVGNPIAQLGTKNFVLERYPKKAFFAFAPIQISNILGNKNDTEMLRFACHILIGGGIIGKELRKKLTATHLPFVETYGMTETLTHVATKKVWESHFKPLANVSLHIDKDSCLMIDYKGVTDSWIQTNDIVELHEQTFIFKGRRDNIINSGGVKLLLDEIEQKISDLNLIQERFFCWGINDEKLGQKLILVVETKDNKFNLDELKSKLGKFETPKAIYTLDAFKETPTSKIDKLKTIDAINIY